MGMSHDEAQRLLQRHLCELDEEREAMASEDGFVTCLRPYTGLREKNYHQVMEALLTVGEAIHASQYVERELIHVIWSLCLYPRMWGLHPEGMLKRNDLITAEDAERLARWTDDIELTTTALLGGSPVEHAVYHYAEYVIDIGWSDNIGFFISLMGRVVARQEKTAPSMILAALSKLGKLAEPVLPALRETLAAEYPSDDLPGTFNTPEVQARWVESTKRELRQTIEAIEGALNRAE